MTEEQVTTVKFNVGGKLYEVSKSLLQRFPNTLLAQKASEERTTTPIFIDRDPDRFAYCLDYMRDGGRLHLPEMITKSSILQELRFLGFDDVNESLIINDEDSRKQWFARHDDMILSAHRNVAKMEGELEDLTMKLRDEKIALICFHKSVRNYESRMIFENLSAEAPFIYRGMDVGNFTSSQTNDGAYFRECCSKLGLEVIKSHHNYVQFRALSPSCHPTNV